MGFTTSSWRAADLHVLLQGVDVGPLAGRVVEQPVAGGAGGCHVLVPGGHVLGQPLPEGRTVALPVLELLVTGGAGQVVHLGAEKI